MHLQDWAWYEIGRYGIIAVLAGAGWLSRQKWTPHRHDGYVRYSGEPAGCSVCGKKPEVTQCTTCDRGYISGGSCSRGCPPPGYGRCLLSCGAIVPLEEMTGNYCAECWQEFGEAMSTYPWKGTA